MIAVALGVPLNSELPPIYVQEATENAHDQISGWLSGYTHGVALDRSVYFSNQGEVIAGGVILQSSISAGPSVLSSLLMFQP